MLRKKTTTSLRRSKLARGASLKRKPTNPLKRKKKTPEAKLKTELWELCKKLTRLRYGNTCYTCDKENLSGSSWQTGHFIPSSICGGYLRYDLRNLRPQCYRCNIDLSGNGSVFYHLLVVKEGQDYVDQLFEDKERITKLNRAFLEEKITEFKALLESLTKE